MRGVFVDANESLAVIFERLHQQGDPEVRINRNPDIKPEDYPVILDGAEIAIVDHTALPTDIAKKCAGLKHVVFLGTGARSYMNPDELAETGIQVHLDPELAKLFRIHVAARAGAEEHDVLQPLAFFGDIGRQRGVVDDRDLGAVEYLRILFGSDVGIQVDPHLGIARLLQPLEDHGQRFIGVDENSAHGLPPRY